MSASTLCSRKCGGSTVADLRLRPTIRYSTWSDVVGSCGRERDRVSTLFPSEEKHSHTEER
jgi:hypothetical protein